MPILLFTLLSLLFLVSSPVLLDQVADAEELHEVDGVMYPLASDKPFTGKFVQWLGPKDAPRNRKEFEINYKDGKKDGLATWWHENGQKAKIGLYIDGKENGSSITWWSWGKKRGSRKYRDGKLDGLVMTYHFSGKQSKAMPYRNGSKDGVETWWYENGKKSCISAIKMDWQRVCLYGGARQDGR